MTAKSDRRRTSTTICHILYRLDYGGLENGLVNLINRLPDDRYTHAIVCLTDATAFRERIVRDDVQVFSMGKGPGNDPRLHLRVWRLLRRLRPDIVHVRNLPTLEMLLPARLAGARNVVYGEHGLDVRELDERARLYRRLRRWCHPLIGRYVAVSRDLGGWLRRQVGVPEDRLTVIYNGVDARRFQPRQEGGPTRLPPGFAPAGAIIYGAVGRLESIKDQVTLARAFVALVQGAPDLRARARLVIVGDGSLRGQIEDILTDGGVRELAWLPGFRDDLPEFYRSFDVFVLPSRREGISNTALEAMASGLPVIATDVGGNPEVVADGATGSLVPPADPSALAQAMHAYAAQPSLAPTLGAAGRQRALEIFSLDAMLGAYDRLYSGMTGRLEGNMVASPTVMAGGAEGHGQRLSRRADRS